MRFKWAPNAWFDKQKCGPLRKEKTPIKSRRRRKIVQIITTTTRNIIQTVILANITTNTSIVGATVTFNRCETTC